MAQTEYGISEESVVLDAQFATASTPAPNRAIRRELMGIALLMAASYVAGALIAGGGPTTRGASCWTGVGAFGPVGACLRAGLLSAVGPVAAVIIPLVLALFGLRVFGAIPAASERHWRLYATGLIVIVAAAAALARGAVPGATVPHPKPDFLGGGAAWALVKGFGQSGAWLLLGLMTAGLMVLTPGGNPMRPLASFAGRTGRKLLNGVYRVARRALTPRSAAPCDSDQLFASDANGPTLTVLRGDAEATLSAAARSLALARKRLTARTAAAAAEGAVAAPLAPVGSLPPLSLFDSPIDSGEAHADQNAQLEVIGYRLSGALRSLKIDGVVVGRAAGAAVTRFDVRPAPGTRMADFMSATAEVAAAVKATALRIVPPIPGRATVGVEVASPIHRQVLLRELLEAPEFDSPPRTLPIAIGRDIDGRAVVADLATLPHLLIAGSDRGGKTVCIQSVVASLLHRHTPATLRLLLVDPSAADLTVYDRLPHRRHRVVRTISEATAVLDWSALEMERRFEVFSRSGARNLRDYNAKGGDQLPSIVVVVNEFVALIRSSEGVEAPLAMLGQRGRAAGIHLVLATREPAVDVVTPLIRANFPSRIGFRVESAVDSHTILGCSGAESLIGDGDMLFIPPGRSDAIRLQGAFISADETARLVDWWADHAPNPKNAEPEADILASLRRSELESEPVAPERQVRTAGI